MRSHALSIDARTSDTQFDIAVPSKFRDRAEAGEALARSLETITVDDDVVVLGLARGGVPVARRVADTLRATFGVIVTQKIPVPGVPELALAAIAEGNQAIVVHSATWQIGVPSRVLDQIAARERVDLERRIRTYREVQSLPDVRRRTVVLVDDGLESCVALRAAARAIRKQRPKRLIAAVPVASYAGIAKLSGEVDKIVTLLAAESLSGVSEFYESFAPVTDRDVVALLSGPKSSAAPMFADRRVSDVMRDLSDRIAPAWPQDDRRDREVTRTIACGGEQLTASLGAAAFDDPFVGRRSQPAMRRLVVLAQSSNSSREEFRARYIAGRARVAGHATMRVDLVTPSERRRPGDDASMRVDLPRLVDRLLAACDSPAGETHRGSNRMILAGSGVGAAAAIAAAAQMGGRIAGVVSIGGRVDLAASMVGDIDAPALLIVGANDHMNVRRSADVVREFGGRATLIRIPRAGHAFEEPGALGAVAEHVAKWLERVGRAG